MAFQNRTDLTEIERRGGVMVYIREDILSKLLDEHVFAYDMEGLFVELSIPSRYLLF